MSVRSSVEAWLDEHHAEVEGMSTREAARYIVSHSSIDGAIPTVRDYINLWRKSSDPAESPEPSDDLEESVWKDDYLDKDRVHYNQADDVYVIFLDHRAKAMPLDGEDYRALKRAYSNWAGDESTINEIKREFGISRQDFIKLKDACGWTHDSPPFSDEEILEAAENGKRQELTNDLLALEERKLHREWQKEKWRKTEKDATKWREFERSTIEPILSAMESAPKRTGRSFEPSKHADNIAAMLYPTDAHLEGQNLEGGFEKNRFEWLGAHEKVLSYITGFARPEKIYMMLGSDQFDVDNYQRQTTKGTQQQVSVHPYRCIEPVAEAGCEMIEMARDIAPVEVGVVPGNHDRRTARVYLWGLKQRYADCDDVRVFGDCRPYQYRQYGDNLLAWHHGDGIGGGQTQRQSKLTEKMVSDVPNKIGETTYRYWFLGHRHSVWASEGATLAEQAPTTKPHDEWEDFKGFPEGHRAAAGWVFGETEGQISRFLATIE